VPAKGQTRVRAVDRRAQVLAVATQIFARQGFAGTTTRQIAEAAAVNEAIIFRHFSSKEELYWAVIEEQFVRLAPARELEKRYATISDTLELFTTIAQDVLDRNSDDHPLKRLLLFSALENHRLSSRFYRQYAAGFYELLAGYVRERIERGEFRPVDPVLAARGFLGMMIYHDLVQDLFGGKRYQKFDRAQVARFFAELWLQAMRACEHNTSASRETAGSSNRE
jgi:AcrR family transcriptional regulator